MVSLNDLIVVAAVIAAILFLVALLLPASDRKGGASGSDIKDSLKSTEFGTKIKNLEKMIPSKVVSWWIIIYLVIRWIDPMDFLSLVIFTTILTLALYLISKGPAKDLGEWGRRNSELFFISLTVIACTLIVGLSLYLVFQL
ncbi:MAG: hypothetical protein PHX30_02625 [Candidatus Pacebacteria bacterium]|jgi:hypothetical protein|nr:hypothetical protein [Candidatus Paceibacterota bacterium]